MNLGLDGKVVLITGAGSGIGQSIAAAFGREGARVAVNDRDEALCDATLSMVRGAGADVLAAAFDVSQLPEVRTGVARIMDSWGPVDVIVNNAAVMLANVPFIDSDPDACDMEIRVGLLGSMHCARAVLRGMIDRGGGRIVNIVSDAARVGQEKEVAYSSAKGGLIAFTKSLAREVGRHGITVNAVSPAATDTPLRREMLRRMEEKIGAAAVVERERKVQRAYPLGRIGEPEDIAASALFLASAHASYITGQILSVNGGYAMPG